MVDLVVTQMPLKGHVLIEASAGTGKTFTISSLFLRLILEEGLSPEQILVVTFTRAATEELRTKLRQRLADALDLLRSAQEKTSVKRPACDAILEDIMEHACSKLEKDELEQRLHCALLSMDQAAIFTIHGFCLKVLKEFAFEASAVVSELEVKKPDDFIPEAIRQYLRTRQQGSSRRLFHEILIEFFPEDPSVELAQCVVPFIRSPEPAAEPQVTFPQAESEFRSFSSKVKALSEASEAALDDIRRILTFHAQEFFSYMKGKIEDDALKALETAVKKKITNKVNSCMRLTRRLKESFLPNDQRFDDLATRCLFKKHEILDGTALRNIMEELFPRQGQPSQKVLTKKFSDSMIRSFHAAAWQWFDQTGKVSREKMEGFDAFIGILEKLCRHRGIRDRARASIIIEAAEFAKSYLIDCMKRQGWISHDSILKSLADVLCAKQGRGLCHRIASMYPVALIDEFQDTDPVQWQIFKAIYSDGEQSRLFLIGDPKQAIYGFRGADIFTYLKAKESIPKDKCFSLGTNWRSSPAVVKAVNRVFSSPGSKAFVLEGIEYSEVDAVEQNDWRLVLDDPVCGRIDVDRNLRAPLEMWLCFQESGTESGSQRASSASSPGISSVEATARCIRELIELGSANRLHLVSSKGGRRPVAPGDITVLVESHFQARQVREALFEQGLASVYYGPSSVFETKEAMELLYILRAVLNPSDEQAVFTALGTTCVGYDAHSVFRLFDHRDEWDQIVDGFSRLRETWRSRGVLAMITSFLSCYSVPKRLLGLRDGARRLTNLRQCTELLAEAERIHPGPERLFLWLKEAIDEPDRDSDEQQLRLETDENVVTVMTYHRSKGLEFPILFLPFIGRLGLDLSKGVKRANGRYYSEKHQGYVIRLCDPRPAGQKNGVTCKELTDFDNLSWKKELERQLQAEYVRLLYVALTRAKYKIFMGFNDQSELFGSALGRLLFSRQQNEDIGPDTLHGAASMIQDAFKGTDVEVLYGRRLEAAFGRKVTGLLQQDERKSYFLEPLDKVPLARQQWLQTSFSALVQDDSGVMSELRRHEPEGEERRTLDFFDFPTGPMAGNCVHRFFEVVSFRASESEIFKVAETILDEFGMDKAWAGILVSMAKRVFSCQLAPGLRLKDVPPNLLVKEMGFYIPFSHRFARHFSGLKEQCSHGVVKGFIDLLFRHKGRFYLVDYKTNWLGDNVSCYCRKQMETAMDEHDYWLQAAIYARAVHGYLSSCLQGYDFNKDFAGAFYLFVRGLVNNDHDVCSGQVPGILFIGKDRLLRDFGWLFDDVTGGTGSNK